MINYDVKAQVVDIQQDQPKPEDVFIVDTNVWFWMTYTRASQTARPYQIASYPPYVSAALSVKAKLLQCGLSLAELAHQIEQTEREFFNSSVLPKEYRHNYPTERANVVAEVEAAWGQVKAMSTPLDVLIDAVMADAALSRYGTQGLDGYDLFILEAIVKAGIVQVLTDDGDFATVPGIQVFTANRSVIEAARNQGKLIRR